ncbi:hypothetical protein [Nitrospira sp. BLG_2]|uniref:hypothetical protein n=1 Tax=Nitrospira sp. BLG_2 TaxID=3397507 RepID=UPI003B9D7BB3
MVNSMHQAQVVIWSMGISLAVSMSVCWSLSHADTIKDGRAEIQPTATEPLARPIPSAAVPVENGMVLRTLPTVSKPISVGGTTLVPYIGAGFGGGYATEFDRSLNTAQSASSGSVNAGLKSLFGQQLIPNEVQLGIRFPF